MGGGGEVDFKRGDLVTRLSYGEDVLFKVLKVESERRIALLKGVDVRLLADAPLDDLKRPDRETVHAFQQQFSERRKECMRHIYRRRMLEREKIKKNNGLSEDEFFEIPGKVLHIDGDPEYLEECLKVFYALGVKTFGEYVEESEQPLRVEGLLKKYRPDILILTGHDAFLKNSGDFGDLASYRHSRFFAKAVEGARCYEPSKDDLIVFAGACQSHYEALLEAGANFASSPQRVLIHCLDPVFIMEIVAYTSITQTIDIYELIKNTVTGPEGIGGIETRGKFRLGLPRSPY